MKKNNIVAICYDYDKTLAPEESVYSYGYFDKFGIKDERIFWDEITSNKILSKMDNILASLYYGIYRAKKNGHPLKKQDFVEYGKNARYYKGVETWFDRINAYAKSIGLEIEHYIISANVKEFIESTSIAKHFKKIYASSYIYDENNEPVWPERVVNYTSKTQYLYRIKKNILNETDSRVNEKIDSKSFRIPFQNMIYVGDSVTDIPCMSILAKEGGNAIGVYEDLPAKKELMLKLFKQKRINNYCFADYSENSEMEKTVFHILDKIKIKNELENLQHNL